MASLIYNIPPGSMDSTPTRDPLGILDSPSGTASPPRTPPSPNYDPIAIIEPLSREDDRMQLTRIFQTILDLIQDRISSSEAEAAVNNLRGHLDIKAMFPNNSDMIERLRILVDMLHLIRNKLDAMDANVTTTPPRLVRQSNRLISLAESSSDDDSDDDDMDSFTNVSDSLRF